ncbi:MAG: peptidase C45, partial [Meiothermus ruber]|nr:peptidase C45 [Meiothermus ruber]
MLPYLQLSGPPYEQGHQQGTAWAGQIAHNLELYFRRFEVECRLSPSEARERGARYFQAIRAQNPAYAQAVSYTHL